MFARSAGVLGLAVAAAGGGVSQPASAEPLNVVASFSILGDMVAEVGRNHVHVRTLVGPNGDAHVHEPSPADARDTASARLVVVNGLGLEGWLNRLIEASGYSGLVAVASQGVAPLDLAAEGAGGMPVGDEGSNSGRCPRPRRHRPARLAVGGKCGDLHPQHCGRVVQRRSRKLR